MIAYLLAVATILSGIPSGTDAIFPFGPAFIFQTSSRPPNNTAGSFTSNISFDAISNVSNVVVAVSQTMGRSLDNDFSGESIRHVNSSVFLFKDGNWTSYKLRKRRSTFDLAKQITNQVFAAVNSFMNSTANQTTFDLMQQLLNASAINNRSNRQAFSDPFEASDLFDETSQDLLYDVEATGSYSDTQLSAIESISKNLSNSRSRTWRVIFDNFRAIFSATNATMSTLHNLFNTAVDNFAKAIEASEQCWPTESNLAPLANLFRTAADNMGQCYGKAFLDSKTTLNGLRGNLTTPLSFPIEIAQQFNYCTSGASTEDVFSILNESACLAKVPILMEHFALNSLLAYNNLIAEGQALMIQFKGTVLQCAVSELNRIQDQSSDWKSAYGQCVATKTTTESA